MALHNLYSEAHKDEKSRHERSCINIQLQNTYDYVAAYDPWINNDIHYFNLPQRFVTKRVAGIGITQYMILSPELVSQEPLHLLPKMPTKFVPTPESIMENMTTIPISQFSFIGGEKVMLKEYGVGE